MSMPSALDLTGQRVVIVGGTSGMGLAIAELSMTLGADIAIAARTASRVQLVAEDFSARFGRPVQSAALDIADRPAVADFFESLGAFEHLVLPGSEVSPRRYDDLTDEIARASFDSKFWGPFWAAFDARPHLSAGGSVTFFSGVAADRPVPGFVIGAGINGALNALTRSLALEFGPLGVRVNCLAPGAVRTPLWDNIDHGLSSDEMATRAVASLPLRRVGTAEDCALACVLLMLNKFVTGEVLGVDGGAESIPLSHVEKA
jgi:NAD(P)-dependent dehydrogenase (short-subunit alcohol dehydrogenase family)